MISKTSKNNRKKTQRSIGKHLRKIRDKAICRGLKLLTADEIVEEVKRRR